MIGERISYFRIPEKLGEHETGSAYKAGDTKLRCNVTPQLPFLSDAAKE